MTLSINWEALSQTQQTMFYNIASNADDGTSAQFWFSHLVPKELRDNPEEVEVFMNGGTVTQDVWTYDRGIGNGHYEQAEFTIADKDVSHIVSDANGGPYTTDNTIMEDMSVNRSRGAENMTGDELDVAESAIETDVLLIDGGQVVTEVTDVTTAAVTATQEATTNLAAQAIGTVADIAIAGIAAYKVGQYVHNNVPKDWSEDDKIAATGGAAVGTALLALTPPGQLFIGGVMIYKLARLGIKGLNRWYVS